MDRRQDERLPANLDVVMTDLDHPGHIATGWVTEVSQSGVRARMPMRVEAGAIIKLEIADCAFFGQAIHCHENAGCYEIGIEIVRVLIGASDLARLVNAVLAESIPNTPGVVRQPTSASS